MAGCVPVRAQPREVRRREVALVLAERVPRVERRVRVAQRRDLRVALRLREDGLGTGRVCLENLCCCLHCSGYGGGNPVPVVCT